MLFKFVTAFIDLRSFVHGLFPHLLSYKQEAARLPGANRGTEL